MKKKSGNRVFIVPSDDPRRVEGKATLDGKTVTDFNGPYQSFVSKELRDRAGINKKKKFI